MKRFLLKEKGITMMALVLTIIVMIVIMSVLSFYVMNSIQTENFQSMKADIVEIEGKALSYYAEKGILPVYSEDTAHPENRKHARDMKGDRDFFNPNDGLMYGKVNLELLGVTPSYKTTYYMNLETLTVYAIDTIKIEGKDYPRPYEKFAKLNISNKHNEFLDVPPEMFNIDSDGEILSINQDWCVQNASSLSEYLTVSGQKITFHNLVFPMYDKNGNEITQISDKIFNDSGTYGLKVDGSMKIPATIEYIDEHVFPNNCNIEYLYINSKTFSENMFSGGNKKIYTVRIGPNCESIKGIAGTNITKLWVDNTNLSEGCFESCNSLELLVLSNSIERIPDGCFTNTNIRTILTDDVVNLKDGENWPASGTYKEGNIMMPYRLKEIGSSAFSPCNFLKGTLDLEYYSPNLEVVEGGAFSNTGINLVKLPKDTKIQSNAFPGGAAIERAK